MSQKYIGRKKHRPQQQRRNPIQCQHNTRQTRPCRQRLRQHMRLLPQLYWKVALY